MIEYNQFIVGQQIKKYRNEKGISQKKLAELTGISSGYIGDIERGGKTENSSVSMKNICKIAEVLGVSLEDLAYTNLKCINNNTSNSLINKIEVEIDSLNLDLLILLQKTISIFINSNKK